jgi:hypothetical protein
MAYYPNNTRWYYANEGDESVNHDGPEGLKHDLRELGDMFDPNAEHDDNTAGGIGIGNLSHDLVDENATGENIGDVLKITAIPGLTDTDGSTPGTIRGQIKAVWDRFLDWISKNLKPITGLSDNTSIWGQIKSLLGLLDAHEETNARTPETGVHGLRVDASGVMQYEDTDGTWKNLYVGGGPVTQAPLYYGLDSTNPGAAAMDAATGKLILSRMWRYQTVLKPDGLPLMDTPVWTVTDNQLGAQGAIGAKDFIVVGIATNDATVDDVQAFTAAAPYSVHGSQKDGQFKIGISGTIPTAELPVFVTIFKVSGPDEAPIITSTSPLPNGTVSDPYSYQFAAKGTVTKWAIGSGSLPAGLSLSDSGAISGTPTEAASDATFTVQCWYNDTQHVDMDFSMTVIAAGTATITGPSSGTWTVGFAGAEGIDFTASGKTSTESYSWLASGLPSWATTTGADTGTLHIGGTADAAATTNATITLNILAADGQTVVSSAHMDVSIIAEVRTVTIDTASPLQTGYLNASYTNTFTATGADSGAGEHYLWETQDTLPAGLSFDSDSGVLSGTPSIAGSYTFAILVQLEDSSGTIIASSQKSFTMEVSSKTSFLPSEVSAGFSVADTKIKDSLNTSDTVPSGFGDSYFSYDLEFTYSSGALEDFYIQYGVSDYPGGFEIRYGIGGTAYALALGMPGENWELYNTNMMPRDISSYGSVTNVEVLGSGNTAFDTAAAALIDQYFTFDRSGN